MSREDPLMSASEIARMWGTGLEVVLSLVGSRTLPSLDGGALLRQGFTEVPLIRRSWAEFLRQETQPTGRVLEPPEGERVHPALRTALSVHSALDAGDSAKLFELSSHASRDGQDPDSLYARWMEINQGGYPPDSGVGSTIYSLAPLDAVGARVFADAPKTPRAVTKATPALLIAVLPMVLEEGRWKVDLPLYEGRGDNAPFLPELIATPMPKNDRDPGDA